MRRVCLVLQSILSTLSNEEAESQYQTGYKELGSLLYSNAYIKMSLAINGKTLSFLKDKHPEFLYLLKELAARGQVEVIGGGYYDPIFPLLLGRERTAQIDMLSSAITQDAGRRPHTAMLFASSWDASLLSVLKTNGIDCVLLDASAIKTDYKKGIPIVMSDRGKSIDIFPMSFDINNDKMPPFDNENEDCVSTFCYTQEEMANALKNEEFIRLCKRFENCKNAVLSTITEARAVKKRSRAYIPSCLSHLIPGASGIQDFLQLHPSSDRLYHRQILVAILIDQYHGDKARKKSARECLLSSQCGGYLFDTKHEYEAYQMLNEAERQIKDESETLTALDFDEDGADEYVCRMDYHTSVISEAGGEVVSFDAMAGKRLYRYSHSLFSDFFIDSMGEKVCCTMYEVQKFLRGKREVFFQWRGSVAGASVFIRKKYIITSSGFVVQYIIKNEGASSFAAQFAVGFRFLHITEGVKSAMLDASHSDVSAVQLTDKDGGVSFLLEPNEDAILTKNEELDEGVTLSWSINIASGMELEKTISLAMIAKDVVKKEQSTQKSLSEQLSFWDEE